MPKPSTAEENVEWVLSLPVACVSPRIGVITAVFSAVEGSFCYCSSWLCCYDGVAFPKMLLLLN